MWPCMMAEGGDSGGSIVGRGDLSTVLTVLTLNTKAIA